jgi:hypothetical protein
MECIGRFEKSCAEMSEMSDALLPLVRQFLPLRMNAHLCGYDPDESLVLNLRQSEWPDQYRWMTKHGWGRVIGIDINWL